MKKLFLTALLLVVLLNFSFSQNTYPWPSTGNIGIGTTSPTFPLSVQGSIQGRGPAYFTQSTPVNSLAIDASSSTLHKIYTNSGISLSLGTGSSTSQLYLQIGGNIGMGTMNPSTTRLTLAGGGNASPNTGAEVDYGGQSLTFRGENAGGNFDLGNIKMVQPTNYLVDHADMVFLTAAGGGSFIEKMRITASGSVGIGTKSPGAYMLAVKGNIHSQQVNVDMVGWVDYVFKKDYRLTPLSEVKTYIDLNHHLPEIPSEQEIAKDGLNLGEMNKLLLKKVEELTLYLIDENKKSTEQDERINKLEEQVQALLKKKATAN